MEVDRSRGWWARGEPGVSGSDASAGRVVRRQLPTSRHGKVVVLPGKCGVGRIPIVERGVSVVPGEHAVRILTLINLWSKL